MWVSDLHSQHIFFDCAWPSGDFMSLFSSMFPTSHQVISKLALCIDLLACLFPVGLRAPGGQEQCLTHLCVLVPRTESPELEWNELKKKGSAKEPILMPACTDIPCPSHGFCWACEHIIGGFWVEPQHIHERLVPQDREGTTAPLASYMCGHVTRKFSNWPILFSYDTFSKIIPISFHFWSSHQTSYFYDLVT